MLQADFANRGKSFDSEAIDATHLRPIERGRVNRLRNLNHRMILEVKLRYLHSRKLLVEYVALKQGVLFKV